MCLRECLAFVGGGADDLRHRNSQRLGVGRVVELGGLGTAESAVALVARQSTSAEFTCDSAALHQTPAELILGSLVLRHPLATSTTHYYFRYELIDFLFIDSHGRLKVITDR